MLLLGFGLLYFFVEAAQFILFNLLGNRLLFVYLGIGGLRLASLDKELFFGWFGARDGLVSGFRVGRTGQLVLLGSQSSASWGDTCTALLSFHALLHGEESILWILQSLEATVCSTSATFAARFTKEVFLRSVRRFHQIRLSLQTLTSCTEVACGFALVFGTGVIASCEFSATQSIEISGFQELISIQPLRPGRCQPHTSFARVPQGADRSAEIALSRVDFSVSLRCLLRVEKRESSLASVSFSCWGEKLSTIVAGGALGRCQFVQGHGARSWVLRDTLLVRLLLSPHWALGILANLPFSIRFAICLLISADFSS